MSAKSENAEREKWLRDAIELSPDATIIVNESGIISRVNKLAEELFGYPRDEMIDLAVEMLLPEEFRAGHPAHRNTFANSASIRQMSSSLNLMAQKKSGELFPVSIGLLALDNLGEGRQVLASVRDNTELHAALAVAEANVNELRNISDTANDAIITINANSEILSWNAAASRIFGHAKKDAIGQNLSLIIPEHFRQSHFEGVANITGGGNSRIIGKTVEVEGLRKSGEIFPVEMSLATWVGESDRIFGGILRDITERKQAEEALQRAYGIIKDQRDRMEDELNIGREIQMSMIPLTFPPFPDHDEFSVFAVLEPAREVGGDFYDYYFIDEERVCFCIGDVSGKGVPAALFMAMARTLIKSRAADDHSTASILTHVNDELSVDNNKCMFVTVFAVILNIRTGELLYTNAGHNPPYIKRKDGALQCLDQRHGPVIGAVEEMVYAEGRDTMAPGDLLLLFTDGVTEAMDTEDRLFSEHRLEQLLTSMDTDDADKVVDTTMVAVKAFAGEAEQADDITILALAFHGSPEAALIR